MTILIVDDSPIDRRLASRLMEKAGFVTRTAENGRQALAILDEGPVDLVVTDLVMPEMDGLTLVEEIGRRHWTVPVLLMTAYGSDDIALRALQSGAVSYVPKSQLATSLAETVRSVLSLLPKYDLDAPPQSARALAIAQWELGNDLEEIPELIGQIEGRLARSGTFDQGTRIQLSVVLREALVNAMLHGNLGVSSALKEADPDAHDALVAERRTLAPYRDRRVRVSIMESPEAFTCIVSDDGAGFDLKLVPDPTQPMHLERTSGRGLFLIRTFMTAVTHSDGGRTITMVKRRSS